MDIRSDGIVIRYDPEILPQIEPALFDQFCMPRQERLIADLVLEKYVRLSGQL